MENGMLIAFFILISIVAIIATYRVAYKAGQKNFLIHLFKEKYITSEQYQELEEEDI